MALIYANGNASGAHFNPAVTIAFCLRGAFPWWLAPAYVAVQCAGALLAALALCALLGPAGHLGATTPHFGVGPAFGMEVFLTWLLVTIILGTATRYQLIGADAALAAGGTIALCGLVGGPVSGASMNPARSLGPALVGGATEHLWIYLTAPVAGVLLAVAGAAVVRRRKHPEESEAAGGDGDLTDGPSDRQQSASRPEAGGRHKLLEAPRLPG